MKDEIDYSAVAQPESVKKYMRHDIRTIVSLTIVLLAVIGLIGLIIAIPALTQNIVLITDFIVLTCIVVMPIVLIIVLVIRRIRHKNTSAPPSRWSRFAEANGFTFIGAKGRGLFPNATLGSEDSVLLSMSGTLNHKPYYPFVGVAPIPWKMFSLSGTYVGLAFLFANYSLSRYGGNLVPRIGFFFQFYTLVKISDPRINEIPDFITLRRDSNPFFDMLNYRFTHLPDWYTVPVGPEADSAYQTFSHGGPITDLCDPLLSALLSQLYALDQPWIECHDGAFFLVYKKGLYSDQADLEPRFEAIRLIRRYLDTF